LRCQIVAAGPERFDGTLLQFLCLDRERAAAI
jgi:hypothetical protein